MKTSATIPCVDCPFRRVGGLRVGPSQVRELTQLAYAREPQWCHKTVVSLEPSRCRGSELFGAGEAIGTSIVFATEHEMLAAQE